jgi:signal transduction histidine kinase
VASGAAVKDPGAEAGGRRVLAEAEPEQLDMGHITDPVTASSAGPHALSGLNELRRVLGVLRSDRPEVAPQPGLGDLDGLLDSARNGGVTVTSGVTGTPRPLPEGVDLSAYRIVQEALSNAMRHAPGSAVQVRLYYGEAVLVIEVRSNVGTPGPQAIGEPQSRAWLGNGDGHGIIGMRERAAMLGGHLKAGPTANDEFLVTADFPLTNDGLENTP